MINPGSGDLPVGQFEAQNLFPNGKGIPSFASSVLKYKLGRDAMLQVANLGLLVMQQKSITDGFLSYAYLHIMR
jgi:hypothetical protein